MTVDPEHVDPPTTDRADSAAQPWAGRSFTASTSAYGGDDGTAPLAYAAALDAFRAGRAGVEAVVDALRGVRLLVPLLAEAGADSPHRPGARAGAGHSSELALVTVAAPDGRRVLPAFSSTAAMTAWNAAARPIPAPARQVALGAAADGTELVMIDAATDRFVLRRSALEALARDTAWTAPWADPAVRAALRSAVAEEPAVTTARVSSGDPDQRLDGAEVQVVIALHETLDQAAVRALLARVRQRWTEDPVVRLRVDSLRVGLEFAAC